MPAQNSRGHLNGIGGVGRERQVMNVIATAMARLSKRKATVWVKGRLIRNTDAGKSAGLERADKRFIVRHCS